MDVWKGPLSAPGPLPTPSGTIGRIRGPNSLKPEVQTAPETDTTRVFGCKENRRAMVRHCWLHLTTVRCRVPEAAVRLWLYREAGYTFRPELRHPFRRPGLAGCESTARLTGHAPVIFCDCLDSVLRLSVLGHAVSDAAILRIWRRR